MSAPIFRSPDQEPLNQGMEEVPDRKPLRFTKGAQPGEWVATVNIPFLGKREIELSRDDAQRFAALDKEEQRAIIERGVNQVFGSVAQGVAQTYGDMTNLQKLATGTMQLPVVGEITGALADAEMYWNDPESRTWQNFGLSAAGMLPAFPSAAVVRGFTPTPNNIKNAKDKVRKAGDPLWSRWEPERVRVAPLDPNPVYESALDLPPVNVIRPEDLEGKVLTSLLGDRTHAGEYLKGLNDMEFQNPVYLEGGHGFMRSHIPYGAGWASNKGRIEWLSKRVKKLQEQYPGREVAGVYVPMSEKGGDFSTMMADTLLEQMKLGNISKRKKNQFDKMLKAVRPEWPGIDAPEARSLLDANGALRHNFISTLARKEFKGTDWADIGAARYSITDPALRNVMEGEGGQAITTLTPDIILPGQQELPHKSYDTQIAGQYIGGLERGIPRNVFWPDSIAALEAQGKPGHRRSMELSGFNQLATPEWVDKVSRYLELEKAERGL